MTNADSVPTVNTQMAYSQTARIKPTVITTFIGTISAIDHIPHAVNIIKHRQWFGGCCYRWDKHRRLFIPRPDRCLPPAHDVTRATAYSLLTRTDRPDHPIDPNKTRTKPLAIQLDARAELAATLANLPIGAFVIASGWQDAYQTKSQFPVIHIEAIQQCTETEARSYIRAQCAYHAQLAP